MPLFLVWSLSTRLFVVLVLVLGSLAGPEDLNPRLLHSGSHSFILPVTRRSTLVNLPTFNQKFAQDELRRLVLKYRQANELFPPRGVGLRRSESVSVQDAAPIPGGVRSSISDPKSVFPPLDATNPTASAAPSVRPVDPILPPSYSARVPITDYIEGRQDILYYADIKIGNPPQTFTIDVDTGSSDLFIPSNCPGNQCGNHKQFNSKASTTFVDRDRKLQLSFGSGEADGYLVQDVVSLQDLTVQNQSFIIVSSESDDFKYEPNDGLIGMGFSSIAQSRSPTFFENLIQTRAIAEPMFSLHLTRGLVSGSELCLGCINLKKAIGSSTYFPVVSKTYWTLSMDGLAINGTEQFTDGVVAAIDSGTTHIYVPPDLAASFYALISGSRLAPGGFYAYPCEIPFTVYIIFGMQKFGINMTDFNLGQISEGSSECIGGIVPMSEGFPNSLAIVGVEFLKSWYATFDYSHDARVGFAPSINNWS